MRITVKTRRAIRTDPLQASAQTPQQVNPCGVRRLSGVLCWGGITRSDRDHQDKDASVL